MSINYPDAVELLESLSELLTQEVLPEVKSKEVKYKLRVAVNLIATIQREIKQGGALSDLETAGLRSLGQKTGTIESMNVILASRIRGGEYDQNPKMLLEHLCQTTLAKIEIDNPAYPTYVRFKQCGDLSIP